MTYAKDPNEIATEYARRQENDARRDGDHRAYPLSANAAPFTGFPKPRRGRLIGRWGSDLNNSDEEHLIAENASVQTFGERFLLVEEEADDATYRYFVNMEKYFYLEYRVDKDEG